MPRINGHRLLSRLNELHGTVAELRDHLEALVESVTVAVDDHSKRPSKRLPLPKRRKGQVGMRLLGLIGALFAASALAQDDSEYFKRVNEHRSAMSILVIYLKEGEHELHGEAFAKVDACRDVLSEYNSARIHLSNIEREYDAVIGELERELTHARTDQKRRDLEEEISRETRRRAKETAPLRPKASEKQAAWAQRRNQCYADLEDYERLVATFDKRAPQSRL